MVRKEPFSQKNFNLLSFQAKVLGAIGPPFLSTMAMGLFEADRNGFANAIQLNSKQACHQTMSKQRTKKLTKLFFGRDTLITPVTTSVALVPSSDALDSSGGTLSLHLLLLAWHLFLVAMHLILRAGLSHYTCYY